MKKYVLLQLRKDQERGTINKSITPSIPAVESPALSDSVIEFQPGNTCGSRRIHKSTTNINIRSTPISWADMGPSFSYSSLLLQI